MVVTKQEALKMARSKQYSRFFIDVRVRSCESLSDPYEAHQCVMLQIPRPKMIDFLLRLPVGGFIDIRGTGTVFTLEC